MVEVFEPWLQPSLNPLLRSDSGRLLTAIRTLLEAKQIATPEEIADRIRLTDAATPANGARMVARAWLDPDYRALLLQDGAAAAEALGVPMRGLPPLGVLENAARAAPPGGLHAVFSCYPRAVLGYPPFWFKSAAYRARAVRDPAGVLAEWHTELPPGTPYSCGGQHSRLPLDGVAAATSRN